MALWLKRGRRWQRAHALRPYFPPPYLRLYPAEAGPRWRAAGALEDYAADELSEFVSALINSCRRPRGGFQKRIWQLKEDRLVPSQGISPFPPQGVIKPGLELARLDEPPAQWLVTLHLAKQGV